MDPVQVTSSAGTPGRGAWSVGRSLSLTWWWTFASVVVLQLLLVLLWLPALRIGDPGETWRPWIAVPAAVLWIGVSIHLLRHYRSAPALGEGVGWRSLLVWPPVATVAAAAGMALGTGSVTLGLGVVAHLASTRRWSSVSRRRVAVLVAAVLLVAAVVDSTRDWVQFAEGASLQAALSFSVSLPAITLFSLWWWDLVEELDAARRTEGRLAAAQERLRVANDVHDLQGHHLQVIALQLELADRLLEAGDTDAAGEQVRSARTSVDEARQGTRDLATRFRGVPLSDELSNAADLLTAAELQVDVEVDADADAAPAAVLGPVVRETTTNVLRHGAGDWAELSLTRDARGWTYRISNGRRTGTDDPDGSGLDGITERTRSVGGEVRVVRSAAAFEVVVTVPDEPSEVSR